MTVKREQILLVQQLQNARSALQVLVLDNASKLARVIGDQTLHRVVEVVTQLHEDPSTIVAVALVALPQTVISNCESEHVTLKLFKSNFLKSFVDGNSLIG